MRSYIYNLILICLLFGLNSCADKGPLQVNTVAQVGLNFLFEHRSELPPEFTATVTLSGEEVRDRVFNVKIVDYDEYHRCVDPIEVPMHKLLSMTVNAEINSVEWGGSAEEIFLSPGHTQSIVIYMMPYPQ